MEDTVSRSSLDSSSTGDEYVVVNGEPKLRITGDIRDINDEILDRMASSSTLTSTDSLNKEPENDFNELPAIQSSQSVNELSSKLQQKNAGTLYILVLLHCTKTQILLKSFIEYSEKHLFGALLRFQQKNILMHEIYFRLMCKIFDM